MVASRHDSRQSDELLGEAVSRLRNAGQGAHPPLDDAQRDTLAELYRRFACEASPAAAGTLPSPADALDIAHDVFLDLPCLIAHYNSGDFNSWQRAPAARAARRRTRRRSGETPLRTEVHAVRGDATEEPPGGCFEDYPQVLRASAQLPASDRAVRELRIFADWSHRDVGRRLRISARASEVRFSRGIQQRRSLPGAQPRRVTDVNRGLY
jgi:DNA-directed RNA polymerase specialized sigma24 family protein